MKVSFIATVFNEEENVQKLLLSLFRQTKMPDEIIICDGGSTDKTVFIISNFKSPISNLKLKLLVKKGNRSLGRNEAIRNATGDIIVCSDAGCVLDKNWVKNIVEPFKNEKVDVVAGYYKGLGNSIFQKCLIPYVLVMPDQFDRNSFLPAARSMAFRKFIWKKTGGFPREYSDNEDYVFARKLKRIGAEIIFKKNAVVYWIPEGRVGAAFVMFYRFARGDAYARLFRPKVAFIFIRYIIGFLVLIFAIIRGEAQMFYGLTFLLLAYLSYSIYKNIRYVRDVRAFAILPLLQVISDFAVLAGTTTGLIKLWATQKTQ